MKTVGKKKITSGFVTQTYNEDEDGKHTCVDVEFEAGDPVDYEDEHGETIDEWNEYYPFNMVQPDTAEKLQEAIKCFENSQVRPDGHKECQFDEGLKLLKEIVNG